MQCKLSGAMEEVNFDDYTRQKLIEYLKQRDFGASGLRKEQLIVLAQKAHELEVPVIEPDDSVQCEVTFKTVGSQVIAFDENDDKKFTDNLVKLPPIDVGDVLTYLITTCKWTAERLKNRKKDDGYKLFDQRHVDKVKLQEVKKDENRKTLRCGPVFVIKADCTPQTSQNADAYTPQVVLHEDGIVNTGKCVCPVGNGTCKHVVALLFALADFVDRHRDDGTEVGTDVICKWDKPRKASKPTKVKDLDFSTPAAKKSRTSSTRHAYQPGPLPDQNNLLQEIQSLLQGDSCVATHIVPGLMDESEPSMPSPKMMRELLNDLEESQRNSSDCLSFISELYTDEFVNDIEVQTRGQADNNIWRKQRLGRLTASNFGPAIRYKKGEDDNYIVERVLDPKPFSNEHIEFGIEHEPLARQLYVETVLSSHENGKCDENGLFLCKTNPRYAASPDGVITCDCCEEDSWLLEIKCSSSYRDCTTKEVAKKKRYHFKPGKNGQPILKVKSDWYHQVQAQLFVCDKVYCDFVLFTLKGISVQRIVRDKRWEEQNIPRVDAFYDKYILPKLLN